MAKKVELNPYKGARDFYPEDMYFRQYWEKTCRKVVERYGYQPFDGPMLERIEIYEAKTSEEIVSGQTYKFEDRGGRQVVMRPEMTPTFARMVAARANELVYPLRWYSFPNLWRYERPQKGRLREHWQLNCDLVAPEITPAYELEMLSMIIDVMNDFGAGSNTYVIKYNHRGLFDKLFEEEFKVKKQADRDTLFYLLDRLSKVSTDVLADMAKERNIDPNLFESVLAFVQEPQEPRVFFQALSGEPSCKDFFSLIELMASAEIDHAMQFDPSIVRGFQYYTGLVFECGDRNPENPRAILGGGRYDNLMGDFSSRQFQGLGFGLGDVTFRAFLKTHGLEHTERFLPRKPWVLLVSEENIDYATRVQRVLMTEGLKTVATFHPDKVLFKSGIKNAFKFDPAYLVIVGQKETECESVVVKDVSSKKDTMIPFKNLTQWLRDLK